MRKTCWICFQADNKYYIRPCNCRGDTKYVHEDCFMNYVGRTTILRQLCNVCKTQYKIQKTTFIYIEFYNLYKKFFDIVLSAFVASLLIFILMFGLFYYGLLCVTVMNNDMRYFNYKYYRVGDFMDVVRIIGGYISIPLCLIKFLYDRREPNVSMNVIPMIFIIECKGLFYKKVHFYIIPIVLIIYKKILMKFIKQHYSSYYQESDGYIQGEIVIQNRTWSIKKIISTLLVPFIGSFIGVLFPYRHILNSFLGSLIYLFVIDSLYVINLYYLKRRNLGIIIDKGNRYAQCDSDSDDNNRIERIVPSEEEMPNNTSIVDKTISR